MVLMSFCFIRNKFCIIFVNDTLEGAKCHSFCVINELKFEKNAGGSKSEKTIWNKIYYENP